VKGGTDLFDVGSMAADGFVELVAGDAKLFGPEGDVRGHLGVDLFGIVRTLDVLFVEGVRFVSFRGVVVLGHRLLPRFGSLRWMRKRWVGMYIGLFAQNCMRGWVN